jgi:dTDP-glucose 4,6-dehydratase
MRLLVTGGCGFIGANYVHLVMRERPRRRGGQPRQADVSAATGRTWSRFEREFGGSRYRFVHGDIGDAALVEALITEENIEAVVNFAAETHVDRSIPRLRAVSDHQCHGTRTFLLEEGDEKGGAATVCARVHG